MKKGGPMSASPSYAPGIVLEIGFVMDKMYAPADTPWKLRIPVTRRWYVSGAKTAVPPANFLKHVTCSIHAEIMATSNFVKGTHYKLQSYITQMSAEAKKELATNPGGAVGAQRAAHDRQDMDDVGAVAQTAGLDQFADDDVKKERKSREEFIKGKLGPQVGQIVGETTVIFNSAENSEVQYIDVALLGPQSEGMHFDLILSQALIHDDCNEDSRTDYDKGPIALNFVKIYNDEVAAPLNFGNYSVIENGRLLNDEQAEEQFKDRQRNLHAKADKQAIGSNKLAPCRVVFNAHPSRAVAGSEEMVVCQINIINKREFDRSPGVFSLMCDSLNTIGIDGMQEVSLRILRQNSGLKQAVQATIHTERATAMPNYDYVPIETDLIFEPGEYDKEVRIHCSKYSTHV